MKMREASRLPNQVITWSSYEADKREVCSALGVPVSGSPEVDIELTDKGIKITVKSLG